MDDNTLWIQFKDGNSHVFEDIYTRHINLLANYGRRLCADDDLVKDAIQDLFVDLWKNRRNLGSTNSIEYYLIKAFRRNLIKKIKVAKRYLPVEMKNYEFELSPELIHISAEIEHERVEQLHANLDSLSSRQKEAIFLRFYCELDYSQISQILRVNPQSAYNVVFRALSKLKERMSPKQTSLLVLLFCSLS